MFPSLPSLAPLTQAFKRSQLGLFHGKTKQYGNNVPFSKHKTRRTWLPNVQRKRVFSDTLGENVRVKLTTRALKTIKKHGGLDTYINKTRSELIGWEGMRIRVMLREEQVKQEEQARLEAEKKLLETAEGKIQKAREDRRKAVLSWHVARQDVKNNSKPTIGQARLKREEVGKALGLDGLATPKQTIQYLEMQELEQKRMLSLRI